MLLPNIDNLDQILSDIEKKVIFNLFKEHKTSLYVCFGWIPFQLGKNGGYAIQSPEKRPDGKELSGIGDLWETVSHKSSRQKALKFNMLLEDEFDKLFRGVDLEESYNGEGMATCADTGEPVRAIDSNLIDVTQKGSVEAAYVLPAVNAQVRLAENLREAVIIAEGGKHAFQPIGLNKGFSFRESNNGLNNLQTSRWLNPGLADMVNPQFRKGIVTTFYGGNRQALDEKGHVKTFEMLAEPGYFEAAVEGEEPRQKRFRRLGVLKMDVDNLSRLFGEPKDSTYTSLAAYAELSDQLDWFFSGYLSINL